MAALPNTITVLERFQVAPPPDAATTELSYPLLQFDLVYLNSLTQLTLFHEIPSCSRSDFLHKIIPILKHSLSLSLKHYLPLAGNIIIPPNTSSTIPFVRYAVGDSISLMVAESTSDFHHLTGYHPRKANEFDCLARPLPLPIGTTNSWSSICKPVCAIQITLFPNQGICIAVTTDHSMCDGSSVVRFLNYWASINKQLSKGLPIDNLLNDSSVPFFDRTSLETPDRIALRSVFWTQMKPILLEKKPITAYPQDVFKATFVLREIDIEKLKSFVRSRLSGIDHITSFTVSCAYLWICLVKSAKASAKNEVADEEPEYFLFSADLRGRIKPAVPPTYFGNLLAPIIAESNHGTLRRRDGLATAVDIIGCAIREAVEQPFSDWNSLCENFLPGKPKLLGKQQALRIASSPRFEFYTDFGWGRMKKYEHISTGRYGFMSICKPRDESQSGGIEIGVSMSKMQLDCFAAIFTQLIKEYFVVSPL